MGAQSLVPWDTWLSASEPRYFGEPEEYADIYAFVHANAGYLDGYESAFDYVPGFSDTRLEGSPVIVEGGSGSVCVFLRAKPNDPNKTIIIHIVDWSTNPTSFSLKIRKDALYGSNGAASFDLREAVTYNQTAHEQARASGNYANLSNNTSLLANDQDGYYILSIPAFDPWAMLVVNPD